MLRGGLDANLLTSAVLTPLGEARALHLVTRNLSHFPATYGQIKIVSPADFRSYLQGAQDR